MKKLQASQGQSGSLLVGVVAWIIIIMMIVPGDLNYSPSAAPPSDDGFPITRVLWLACLAVGVIFAFSRPALTLRVWRRANIFLLLFIALAFVSAVWSINPAQTIRNVVRMVTLFLASLAVAVVGWNPRRYQQLVRPPLTVMLLGSIIFGMTSPELAIHQETQAELLNAWHGLFETKNSLGAAASFTFILWAHAWLTRETKRLYAVVGMLIAGSCLILSRSSTSTLTTILAVLTMLLLVRPPASLRRAVPYMTSGLVVLILLVSLAMLKVVPGLEILVAPIPAITGKDLTFSNRANIWAAVVDHVKVRPVLGSGYSAYWIMGTPTPDAESYAIKSKLDGFYPGSAHNGYLQVLNDLGAVGLCCLLGYLYVFVRDSIRLYRIDRTQGALFLVLFLQQTTINLTEPVWLNVLLVEFMLVTMATTCLARALAEAKTQVQRVPDQQTGVPAFQNFSALTRARGPTRGTPPGRPRSLRS
jgi:exopolysaccharide production protein ExoQ